MRRAPTSAGRTGGSPLESVATACSQRCVSAREPAGAGARRAGLGRVRVAQRGCLCAGDERTHARGPTTSPATATINESAAAPHCAMRMHEAVDEQERLAQCGGQRESRRRRCSPRCGIDVGPAGLESAVSITIGGGAVRADVAAPEDRDRRAAHADSGWLLEVRAQQRCFAWKARKAIGQAIGSDCPTRGVGEGGCRLQAINNHPTEGSPQVQSMTVTASRPPSSLEEEDHGTFYDGGRGGERSGKYKRAVLVP